jgi:hypothetical protein
MSKPDHEIIAAIETALLSADEAQRRRVVEWMHARFPDTKPAPVTLAPRFFGEPVRPSAPPALPFGPIFPPLVPWQQPLPTLPPGEGPWKDMIWCHGGTAPGLRDAIPLRAAPPGDEPSPVAALDALGSLQPALAETSPQLSEGARDLLLWRMIYG